MLFKKIIKKKTFEQIGIKPFDLILKKKLLNSFYFCKSILREQSSDLLLLDNHTNYFFKENIIKKNNLIKKGLSIYSKYMLFHHKFDKTIRFVLPNIYTSKINNYVKKFGLNLRSIVNTSTKSLKIISFRTKGGFSSYSLGFTGFFSVKNALKSFKAFDLKKIQKATLSLSLSYSYARFKFFFNNAPNYKSLRIKKNFTDKEKYYFILLYIYNKNEKI